MHRVKQQHFVPRFYLAEWSGPESIWAIDKESGTSIRRSASKLAMQHYTYDTKITSDDTDPERFQYFEKEFSKIESNIAPLFRSIINRARHLAGPFVLPENSLVISEEEVQRLAYFTIVQMLRDIKFRDNMRSSMNGWLKKIWCATAPILFSRKEQRNICFNTVCEDHLKNYQMEFLRTRTNRFAAVLSEKIAVIGFNQSGIPLLTSDSPVLKLGYLINPKIAWDGLASPSSQIVLPMAPDVVLIFFDRDFYLEQRKYDRRIRVLSRYEVTKFNEHQVRQSDKRLFSEKNDSQFVQAILNQAKRESWPKVPKDNTSMKRFIEELKVLAASVPKGTYTTEKWLSIIQQENHIPFGKL